MEKNNSGNSGEHKITLENENLSPVSGLSPEAKEDLSTKSNNSGYTEVTFLYLYCRYKYLSMVC